MVVVDRHRDGDDVVVLTLRAVDDSPLPAWTPGAHIDVILTPSITRQYSLCGDLAEADQWQIAVLKESPPRGRGGSVHVHDQLRVGSLIDVRGPRNNFVLKESARYLFIAGGIGITPLKPMIQQVASTGADWNLVYGGRSLSRMALRADLEPYADRVRLVPEDEHGLIDLDSLLTIPDEDCLIYCCGPEPLISAVEERAAAWRAGALQTERFLPKGSDRSTDQRVFEVQLGWNGDILSVPPHKSILEVLEDNGHWILSSCRSGVCGTCETTVLGGVPEHRDGYLTEDEKESNETILVCVSRAAGPRLILDLES